MIIVQIGTNTASWETYDDGSNGPVKNDNGYINFDSCLKFITDNPDSVDFVHLIEPIIDCTPYINKSYGFFENKKVYNIAITDNPNQTEIDIFTPVKSRTSGHASYNLEHLHIHGHSDIDHVRVPSFTLNNFLEKNSIDKCDRLYVDTEGLDCLILLGYDYNKFKTNYIEFEVAHSDGPNTRTVNAEKCINRLISDGFKIHNNPEDPLNLIATR